VSGKGRNDMRWLLEEEDSLPRGSDLLLHVCCAPCSAGSLRRLCDFFRVTMYFTNSNIDPEEEYVRRLEAARILARHLDIPLVEAPYDPPAWAMATEGLESAPEGGARCSACIGLRLRETALHAADHRFPLFATTLTISPRKNPLLVNREGLAAAELHGVRFLRCDLKKNEGFLESVRVSDEIDLYRQHYCGCRFSIPRETRD
jgi:predicted adenine nucleotide alpha hydrolase (AANH) superfamily ATPase